ncbi:MAG: PaaI family thioesterase [Pseudomonadota bacterium]
MATYDGLALLRAIVSGELPGAALADVLDFRLIEVERGFAVFEGTPHSRFYNPLGTVHGGWAATLLDSCMGCAVHTLLDAGDGYTTLEIKVNYVRPMTEATGAVRAEGRVLHEGRSTATAEGRLVRADGKLLAHGTTTCAIFPGALLQT